MVWLPDNVWLAQKLGLALGGGKGGGKGAWNSWGGKGKGKGKSYLRAAKPENKVWIGGLPENSKRDVDLNKKLMEHMKQGGECKYAEISRKGGSGGAVYKTADEAQAAIALLNGSVFEGHTLEVDVWEKKAKA